MLRRAGKARSAGRTLSSDLAAPGQRQRTRFAAEVAQLLPKRLEVVEPAFIDFGMVAARDQLMFFEAEYASLELAWDGHRTGSCSPAGDLTCRPRGVQPWAVREEPVGRLEAAQSMLSERAPWRARDCAGERRGGEQRAAEL